MGIEKYLLLILSLAALLYNGNGCQIDGVTNWLFIVDTQMYDYHQGTFWSRAAINIAGITNFSPGGGVNSQQYISAALQDGNVTLTTTANYPQYEENETSDTMSFSLTFSCTDGSTNLLTFEIKVIDTNNNDPIFLPDDNYEFTVLPPLPPGFEITGCGQDIVVRDIDLTTTSIIFSIEENPYLEVVYEGRSPTEYKQFLASLRTKDLIRTLPEDVELTISATDVDQTGDMPRTTYATIRLKADEEFQFPEEPIFSQPLYLASYVDDQVILQQPISLQQGFDDEIAFSLDEEQLLDPNLANYFRLTVTGNQVFISVTSLPDEVVRSGQVILVIRADREYTSGDTATVIIQLPEVPTLDFEETLYTGTIVDNSLQPIQLRLKQGYEEDFSVSIQEEYASFFYTTIQGNTIILSMAALEALVLEENNFLTFQVVASNAYGSSAAVVSLDIVKDDTVTPLFDKPIYMGEYTAETGLTVELITLVQGYDENVSFSFEGDHADFFLLTHDGATVTVTSSSIPVEIWSAQHILLTVSASKPRTITSTTTLYISLPPARELSFGAPVYSGTLRDTTVAHPAISLTGYDEGVNFTLDGEYASYFSLSTTQDQVSVSLPTALPDDVILQNRFLTLTLRATGTHALPASTTLLLEILKQDLQTPVFTENVYKGTFDNNHLEVGNISLIQGYDSSVRFTLQGEHSQYFRLNNVENNVILELESEIPADVMFSEKLLVFSVLADKPLSVGANAAVSIAFSHELTDAAVMGFSQNTYVGYLENNELILDNIVLQTGFADPTEFSIFGEFVSYFSVNNTENVITISLANALTEEIIANNKFIVLEINADRERAVAVTASVVIDIKKEEIEAPVFSQPYYVTVYSNGTFEEKIISLSHGYDAKVSYTLDGENSVWFKLTQSGEDVVLSLDLTDGPIPDEILESNNFFLFTILAHKSSGTTSAKAAIFVDIPKEIPKPVIVQFTQSSYVGRIENEEVYAPTVTLLGEQEPVDFILTGDFAQYFEIAQTTPKDVQIQLSNGLPENIDELPFIILDIEAQYPEAISGYTSIVLEVVKQPEVTTPVFEQAYYTGEFSEQGLLFDQSIRLIQGFDESVVFTLAGDDAQFFELIQTENNTLTLVANNELQQIKNSSHLTFSIVASKANSVPGMAAIIIGLPELSTVVPLRFSQKVYRGSIENGSLSINNILLEEGYSPDMNVDFTGDYVAYFQLTNQEGIFTLQSSSDLPVEILDANNILVLTIEVQLGDFSTHTTVILDVIKSEVSALTFEEAYYVGWYSIIGGFTFDPQITLSGGYDETVSFSLEGEASQWFRILEDEYPITLTQSSPIPNDIVSNNQQLIFVIVGEKPEHVVARSTIIVIIDGNHNNLYLSFDQLSYLGSIENDVVSLQLIALSEGYTEDVSFILHGELERFFNVSSDDERVTISLKESLPEDLTPENKLIILELQATAPQTLPASATIILQIKQEQIPTLQQLAFDATYYTGYYSELEGLTFEENIKLSVGYDEYVQFTLEGDDAQYFEAVTLDNSVTLRQINAIPVGIMLTNHLIFTIRAERTNAVTSKATIIISLIDDRTENMVVLGFSRVSYSGSIENNTVSTDTIVLSEGYSELVTFTLFGDLADYFTMTSSETVVEISLSTQIPEGLLPLNRIIVLDVQAAAPQAKPAYTTLVIEVMLQEDADEMIFSSLYYTGEYSQEHGLNMSETISLALGYDETVQFSLQGEKSQWFQIETSGNAVTLSINGSISSEILENHNKLIFFIFAEKSSRSASAVIVISLVSDETSSNVSFDKVLFEGTVEDGVVTHEVITVNEYDGLEIVIFGDNSELFSASITDGVVTVQSDGSVTLPATTAYVALELRAGTATAVLLLNVIQTGEIPEIDFDKSLYRGRVEDGVVLHEVITLTGYEGSSIQLDGDYAELFTAIVTDGEVVVQSTGSVDLPATLTFVALELRAGSRSAVLLLEVVRSGELPEVTFDKTLYQGKVEDNVVTHETIILTGFPGSSIQLQGEYSTLFTATVSNGVVTVQSTELVTLPTTLTFVALEIGASSASAMLLLELIHSDEIPEITFDKSLYQGSVEDGVVSHETIILTGYDGSEILLDGDYSDLFAASITNGVVTIQGTGSLTLPTTLTFVALELRAGSRSAVLLLDVIHSGEQPQLSFDKILYEGRVEDGVVTHEPIALAGYSGSSIQLAGEHSALFTATVSDGVVTVQKTESVNLPATLTFVALELEAVDANAVLLLEVIHSGEIPEITFDKSLYQGSLEDGVVSHETIILTGYDGSEILLDGDYSDLFTASINNGVVTVQGTGSLVLPATLNFVVLELRTRNASAVLLINVVHSGELPEVTFNKTLYQGRVEGGVVTHEPITLSGYSGSNIQLEGEYSALFIAVVSNGVVTVSSAGSVTLPATLTFVALELQASGANSVLVLGVTHNETPLPPTVTFSSLSYNLRVNVTQTGMVGRVEASADNGEDVTYSLSVQDAHLLQRISISNNGELYLSAPANSGAHSFQVIATTVFSDATGTATAHLTVEAIISCGDDNYVIPPLQIFDRDEESSHSLITFNQEEFPGCRYTLSNRWPTDQQWLYVDETGLHTLSIDREHASIAFMALSQVQVELTLECDNDGNNVRTNRAVGITPRIDQLDHLGPYDYGPYKWILTDSILHDSRKSLVNLIVNDINDNYPIFLGVENQPLTVGWPVADLEERIVPRYLAEVKATDADIGENAALVYWSNEEVLAVSPTTGLVHVRNNAQLEDNVLLTVYATDRNGEGLTCSLELLVKLIDTSHIAVVTVRNAFLVDEEYILSNLSASVGYEIKALRVTVVTDTESEEINSRKKREVIISTGAPVQLFVYGLIQREPVEVQQLTEDIHSIQGSIETVIIASTLSLEDHLETLAICSLPGRDIGLLVSTIVLAVLLFILIVVAAVWFFLKWRKEKNYEQFSDVNSLASRNDSPKLTPKPENTQKPRINIEELKRSERRLQEMLDAPVTEVTVEQPSPKVPEKVFESKLNIPAPPLVIQSIDKLKAADDDSEDEDEFGERKKARRKSVVTFNENVERIIHVEDPPNDDDTDFEVYRL